MSLAVIILLKGMQTFFSDNYEMVARTAGLSTSVDGIFFIPNLYSGKCKAVDKEQKHAKTKYLFELK